MPTIPRHAALPLALALSALHPGDARAGAAPTPPDAAWPPVDNTAGALHVPSPDWRDQVIYFVLTDRFDDGDPRNNDQGAGEYDPRDPARYSGGDLAGVARRLGYIRGLGATAVWITPPVAHQWWDAQVRYGGYHGYWATDFAAVDPHFGTLDDYRALSRGLHGRGMYLVQDVVLNHVGNYFGYGEGFDPADPATGYQRHAGQSPAAITAWPFSLNDPRDPAQRAAGIYHWTRDITDYADPVQEATGQMAGLDDLDTANPLVREALRRAYAHWIREVGVDAFRVDTAFYVGHDDLTDFVHGSDPDAPGMAAAAAATGRTDFHVFGEGFGIDRAGEDASARRIEGYMRRPDGTRVLPGMINFPLYGALDEVFARGRPTATLAHRIASMQALHPDLHRMPSFLDNHDVDRFLAGGSEAGLRQGLLALMTLPGIPVIYYGTEQGLRERRPAMFAAGWGSGGADRFDAGAPLYRYLARATALRHAQPALRRGTATVLAENAAGPGPVAWRMDHEGASLLVAMNTADAPALLDIADTGLAAGTRLRVAFAIDEARDGAAAAEARVGAGGRLLLALPARAGLVLAPVPGAGDAPVPAEAPTIAFDDTPALAAGIGDAPVLPGDTTLSGHAAPGARLQLVVDDALGDAPEVLADAEGRWQATLDTGEMADPAIAHRVLVRDAASSAASAPLRFRVERAWRVVARADDPAGDDHGPDGRYSYPTGSRWRLDRPADLLGAEVAAAGRALRVDLRMPAISRAWSPANGFDHVAFTVYLEVPGRDGGATLMPLQNATLPGGMRWHWRLRTHGWSNALTSSDGADAGHEGTPAGAGAAVSADPATATVRLLLPGALLRGHDGSRPLRLHVTTWDYDGIYRPLRGEAGAHAFGGGDGTRDPLVMDALTIEVPAAALREDAAE